MMENSVFVNGEGLVTEDMVSAVSSMLGESPTFSGRLLFVRTMTKDGTYKFSSRKCLGCKIESNLGSTNAYLFRICGGIGGGHFADGRL